MKWITIRRGSWSSACRTDDTTRHLEERVYVLGRWTPFVVVSVSPIDPY